MKEYPSSVYRLQLTENFNIKRATERIDFLVDLGVEGVYCSPYFAAHSPHGYDGIDPNQINLKLATEKEYEAFCKKLQACGLFHIADLVPNHMAAQGDNPWWWDVLEKGEASSYAPFFDIYWEKGKVLLPVLSESFKEAKRRAFLKVVGKGSQKCLKYRGLQFPLKGHYRLAHWKEATQKACYRRFFNINELVGVRIEIPEVFDKYHKLLFKLIDEGKINGLRIDHPDGLYDPKGYFKQLRRHHKGPIFVEKILGWKEEIPKEWEVEGSVGYEFLNLLTGLYVKKNPELTRVYENFAGIQPDFSTLLQEKKRLFIEKEMAGDLSHLARLFYQVFSRWNEGKGIPLDTVKKALKELLIAFPIYRTYISPKERILKRDLPYIKKAFILARKNGAHLGNRVFHCLESLYFLKHDTKLARHCLLSFQQLSAPIMAKGFEDITLYNFNRLLALNEVGGFPEKGGVTKEEFHIFCQKKSKDYPYGILTTSTHDTKRSMDVRMQLATLSEIPKEWGEALSIFSKLNAKYKQENFPDPNAEIFFYQILLGVYPSKPSLKRMWLSFQKSIREARAFTSWNEPNAVYEKACRDFVYSVLKSAPFLKKFRAFEKKIRKWGEFNTLSATALHLGCPGIVDIYQGCENFCYTLVDPDNRKPVSFEKKRNLKFDMIQRGLHFRKKHKDLFLTGEYEPVDVKGKGEENVVAFLRVLKKQRLLVCGVRFFSKLHDLSKTEILLPCNFGKGVELFSRKTFEGKRLFGYEVFSALPFAWVFWEDDNRV